MPTKPVIEMEARRERRNNAKLLIAFSVIIVALFVALLLFGFENILSILRYRVTLFLLLGPLLALFLWCAYKAFGPRGRS